MLAKKLNDFDLFQTMSYEKTCILIAFLWSVRILNEKKAGSSNGSGRAGFNLNSGWAAEFGMDPKKRV